MPSWVRHCEVGSGLTRVAVSMWPDTAGTGRAAAAGWAWAAGRPFGDAVSVVTADVVCARATSSAAAPVPRTGIDLCAGVFRKVELLRTGTERDAPEWDPPLAWHGRRGGLARERPEITPSRYES